MSAVKERKNGTPTNRATSPNPTKKDELKTPTISKDDEKKNGNAGFISTHGKKILIIAIVAVAVFALKKQFADKVDIAEQMEKAVHFVEGQGNTAVYWYCAFTFVGVCCLIPTTPMEIAGGFLFSPTYGFWMVSLFTGVSKLAANVVSVLIARFVVKDWVMKNVVAKSDLLQMVSEAVKEEPWKMAFLVRGSMVPLFVKNYGLGVMDIDYLPIAACSSIFTNFYAMQNLYMGSAMQDIKEVFAPKKAATGPMDWSATAKKMMPVAFNILLVVFLIKAIAQQMKKQTARIEEESKKKQAVRKNS